MANVNQVTLIGYLGKDPQISTTQQGIKVARLSVGTTERGYTSKSGQQIPDRTEWHDVVLWRQSAEFAERFCKKGAQVYVQGKLRHRSYTDKDNQTRYVTEVEADDFQSLDRANQNQQQVHQQAQSVSTAPVAQDVAQSLKSNDDDDLPF
jgi:single-strand DNA-binding protein